MIPLIHDLIYDKMSFLVFISIAAAIAWLIFIYRGVLE
jgi:hypothetical protein